MELAVPEVVRRKALLDGAGAWLDDLPWLVRGIERDWGITVGRAYERGTEAYVAPATDTDGELVVLKLLIPRAGDGGADEATVLRLADGKGCARLLRHDPERSALLLERLGPPMADLGLPFQRRLPILCDVAARVWRPAPDCGLPTGADKARSLTELICTLWESVDRPCSERTVEHALACADRRTAAHDDERARLLHGDVHQWNALASAASPLGFAMVDPDGLLAEPEYDLGILMREDTLQLMRGGPAGSWSRAHWLAARTGLDAQAIWEWGVLERLSTGLLGIEVGLKPGHQMVAAAEAIAAAASG